MNYEALLAQSEPWLQYAIRIQLLRQPKDALAALRAKAFEAPKIATFLKDIADFHGTLVTSHKNAGLPIHMLLFLLDLGLDTDVPEIRTAIDEILRHRDANGIYQSLTCVPVHFGGTGKDAFCWCLCDAPLLLTALVIAGADMDTAILPGVACLAALVRENGFPCAVSPELGTFRGPGKKGDCCPYATLIMAGLLARIPQYRDSQAARIAVETLLSLWENSLTEHPYIFYMGTDFRKLKAPPLWYDIVSVLDVLSRYPYACTDPRFMEMLAVLNGKRNPDDFFTPESVYAKMKDWDFGQKKAPSPYLTFLCERILQRTQEV